jgi:hypothetical protein
MGFREIAVTGDALQLAPGLAAGVPIRTDVAASAPAVIGALVIRTEVLRGVDGAPASSDERDNWRGLTGCLGACIGSPLIGLAQRFVKQPGKELGFF